MPADIYKFTSFVRSADFEALHAPNAAVLDIRKSVQAVFTAHLVQLDELVDFDGKAKAADWIAIAATQARDVAGAALRNRSGSLLKQDKADTKTFSVLPAQLNLRRDFILCRSS
jgi:hypothetical protein